MCQGMALNADEGDWSDARRERQEALGEKQSFGLALLVSTLAKNRKVDELECVAHHLWAQLKAKKTPGGVAVSDGTVYCTRVPAERSGKERAPGRLGPVGHCTGGDEPNYPCTVVVGYA